MTPGDVDFFVITVSESGILNASSTGGTDTIGAILSERSIVHDLDDDSGDGINFWMSASVSAGTYYIGVAGYDTSTSGYYTLHVSFRGSTPPIAPDDHGDSLITATRVSRSSETAGNLVPSDVDFFAISVNQTGTLTATTFGNTDTFGVLHDQRHALDSDDDSGIGYNFWVASPVSAGTYFIEVKGYGDWTAGDYTLVIGFSTDSGKPTAVRSVVSSVSVGNAAGVLYAHQLPDASDGPDVRVSGSSAVISGGAFFLDVEPEVGFDVDKMLISFAGERFGYYSIDLPYTARSYRVVGYVPSRVDLSDFSLSITAVDRHRAVGRSSFHLFDVVEVGVGGDVHVSLSWDVNSDVDLHIIDPNGDEIYWNNRSTTSGGVLDLDSNAACVIDGVRNENVTWPEGSASPGLYTVRVNYWSSCGVPATNYVVSINHGGQVSRFSGRLTGRGQQSGPGELVTTFAVP